ncbi:MAG TPA: BMP family protein [Steroidobacteraceae bacterium]|jgi:simple sugar transport system substrate-binding protein|nr:BMP family protein [Steroidobacteraceae bacterium]
MRTPVRPIAALLPTALLPAALVLAVAAAVCGAARTAQAAEVKSLALMLPEEPTDYGWNQQAFNAAKIVCAKYGLKFMPATGLGYGDVHEQLRELADDGASLIVAHASGYNTAAPEIGAEAHIPVAIVDRPQDSKPGAVADYTVSGYQGAYLAGVMAARMTKTRVVAIINAAESPPWNSQAASFAQGVKATDPGVRVLYSIVGAAAYADVAGGRRVTEQAIGAGADVVFGEGDRSAFGMLQAVETTKSTGGGTVWFIDEIGDKSAIDKGHLLSSVVWNLVPVYSAMIQDLKTNKFGTHAYTIQLADDSVQLLHTKHIPDAVWTEIEAKRRQIIDGTIKIVPIWDSMKVRALMTSVAVPPK